MKLYRLFTMLALAPCMLATKSRSQTAGTVTGQVILGDSHLPGRMASVSLISTKPTRSISAESTSRDTAWSAKVQSLLDGSFSIPNVPAGNYYLLVEKLGYVSPAHLPMGPYYTTKEEEDLLAKMVAPIAVIANRTTRVDAILTRGASISGVLRFDDGSPDAEGLVSLMHKDKDGNWVPYLPGTSTINFRSDGGRPTDDQGHFRFAGLPAGEYLLKSIVEISEGNMRDQTSGGDSMIYGDYAIDCYYGDGIRLKDAKTIKVTDGEQTEGNDIAIPLTKLHTVSGAVVSLETGETVNSAKLELHYVDDDLLASKTEASPTGSGFNFPYVPEGEYTLKVTHAADVNPKNWRDTRKPIRTYADSSQPIIVKGEMSSITIQVKSQPAAAASATAQ